MRVRVDGGASGQHQHMRQFARGNHESVENELPKNRCNRNEQEHPLGGVNLFRQVDGERHCLGDRVADQTGTHSNFTHTTNWFSIECQIVGPLWQRGNERLERDRDCAQIEMTVLAQCHHRILISIIKYSRIVCIRNRTGAIIIAENGILSFCQKPFKQLATTGNNCNPAVLAVSRCLALLLLCYHYHAISFGVFARSKTERHTELFMSDTDFNEYVLSVARGICFWFWRTKLPNWEWVECEWSVKMGGFGRLPFWESVESSQLGGNR